MEEPEKPKIQKNFSFQATNFTTLQNKFGARDMIVGSLKAKIKNEN
jgi:hypothetical protein